MGSITGLTAPRMLEIESASIVAARKEVDNLILTTFGGTDIDVGNIRGTQGIKGDTGDAGTIASQTVAGISELATDAEANAFTDTGRTITPSNLGYLATNRWEKTATSVAGLGSGIFVGQLALLSLLVSFPNFFNVLVIWTGGRWEPVSPRLSGTTAERNIFTGIGPCFEGVEWYSTTDKTKKVYDGTKWLSSLAGLVPIIPTSIAVTGTSFSAAGRGAIDFTDISSLRLDGAFSADFDNYLVKFRVFSTSTNSTLCARLRTAAPASDGRSLYNQGGMGYTPAGATVAQSRLTGTYFEVGRTTTATPTSFGDVDIILPFPSTHRTLMSAKGYGSSGGAMHSIESSGMFDDTVSFPGLEFYALTGTVSGRLTVYGYNL